MAKSICTFQFELDHYLLVVIRNIESYIRIDYTVESKFTLVVKGLRRV